MSCVKGQRGAGIATILMVMAVLGAIALTIASTTTFHTRMVTRQSQADQARNLAESVLSKAMDRLVDERDFGTAATSSADEITVQYNPNSPTGRLTFHAADAQSLGIPVSVNNLENDSSVVMADGRTLPAFSVYLAAVAEYGGVSKVVESVMTIPLYKYALATSGSVVSNGGLLVAAIDENTDLSVGLSNVPQSELLPGHVAANGTTQTVLASGSGANSSLVTGDVIAGGTVNVGQNTDVQGAVKENQSPEELPELEVTDYDPTGWVGVQSFNQGQVAGNSPLDPLELEGIWHRSGNLQVAGDLDLSGGCYVFVDGNLSISGSVTGKGSIFSTGNVSIGRASGFSSDNVAALIADGDITLSGGNSASARDSSFFNGLIFGRGNMNLSNVTVVGSVVNNSPTASTMTLNNVGLLLDPKKLQFNLRIPMEVPPDLLGTNDAYYKYIPAPVDYASFYNPVTDSFSVSNPSQIPLSIYQTADVGSYYYDDPVYIGTYGSDQAVWFALQNEGHLNTSDTSVITNDVNAFRAKFELQLNDINDLYQQTKQESLKTGEFNLDPNQFIPFEERCRVIWVKERGR